MVDANLTGFGQAKTRSINVEVNLLEDWAADRVSNQLAVRKNLGVLIGVCMTGLVILPFVTSWRNRTSIQSARSDYAVDQLRKKRDELALKAAAVTPSIDYSAMIDKSRHSRDSLLRECSILFDAAPDNVQFDTLKIEIASGEVTMKVVANAINAGVGRLFVERAGRGKNVLDSKQTSVRQSAIFGEAGIVFDYTRRAKVKP